MTDADVIAAIRAKHLKANISDFEDRERRGEVVIHWDQATVDPGGTIFGPGPYVKVPVTGEGFDGTRHRVYAPKRLQMKLAAAWRGFKRIKLCQECGFRSGHAPKCPKRKGKR